MIQRILSPHSISTTQIEIFFSCQIENARILSIIIPADNRAGRILKSMRSDGSQTGLEAIRVILTAWLSSGLAVGNFDYRMASFVMKILANQLYHVYNQGNNKEVIFRERNWWPNSQVRSADSQIGFVDYASCPTTFP